MPQRKNQVKQPPSRGSERVGGKEPGWKKLPNPDDLIRTSNYEKREREKSGKNPSTSARPNTGPRSRIVSASPSDSPTAPSTSAAMIPHPLSTTSSTADPQSSSGMEMVLHPESPTDLTIIPGSSTDMITIPGSYPSQELVLAAPSEDDLQVATTDRERQVTTLHQSPELGIDCYAALPPNDPHPASLEFHPSLCLDCSSDLRRTQGIY